MFTAACHARVACARGVSVRVRGNSSSPVTCIAYHIILNQYIPTEHIASLFLKPLAPEFSERYILVEKFHRKQSVAL